MGCIDIMKAEDHAVESICRVCAQGCQIAAPTYRSWKRTGRVVAARTVGDAHVVDVAVGPFDLTQEREERLVWVPRFSESAVIDAGPRTTVVSNEEVPAALPPASTRPSGLLFAVVAKWIRRSFRLWNGRSHCRAASTRRASCSSIRPPVSRLSVAPCWCTRVIVDSAETIRSTCPAAAEEGRTLAGTRSQVPSADEVENHRGSSASARTAPAHYSTVERMSVMGAAHGPSA
jgi:hypothetical protein